MIRLVLFLMLIAVVLPAHAQRSLTGDTAEEDAERLWFTVTTEPETPGQTGGWVGQEIILDVRLVSSDPFQRLRLDIPDIDGARVETLIRPHTLQINMFGGRGYSHSTRLAIVPTRAGQMTIPRIAVSGIAQQRNGRSVEFVRSVEAQPVTIRPPDRGYGGAHWVVSREVEMTDAWSADINALRAGDMVRRTVELTVTGARADLLPDMNLAAGPGYRVLASETTRETVKAKTGFTAHLVQTWDLYIESDEITYVDAVHVPYWNPDLADTSVASVPSQRIEPILRDATALRDRLRAETVERHQTQRIGLIALMALPGIAILVFAAMAIWHALPTRADRALSRSGRSAGTALAFYQSYQDWGRETLSSRRPVAWQDISPLGEDAGRTVRMLDDTVFAEAGGAADPARTATVLVRSARRRRVSGYLSTILPRVSQFLFLK